MTSQPITIDGSKNFTPDPTGAMAWLAKREIKNMLAVSLFGALLIVGGLL